MVLTRRILVLIAILLGLGEPYSKFILMEAFSIRHAPSYSHRIGFMCSSIAAALSILTILYLTGPAREMIQKFLTIKKRLQQRDMNHNGCISAKILNLRLQECNRLQLKIVELN